MHKKQNNIKLLRPKIDVVFHALFREENKRITEAMLTDILGKKVKIKSYMDRYLNLKSADEKLGIMDLRVELEDGSKCNLEIQLNRHENEIGRFTFYLTDMYARQLKVGDSYSKLNKVIGIIILDHEIDLLKDYEGTSVNFLLTATKCPTKGIENNAVTIDSRNRIKYN